VKQNFIFCSKQLQLSLSTYQRSHPCDFVSAPTKTHTRSNEHLPEHCFFVTITPALHYRSNTA